MIIGTCGFGSSGSSAVSDFLKEYNRFSVLDDFEYFLAYCPDGLVQLSDSLYCHPSRNDSAAAMFERTKKTFLKKIVKSSFVKQSKIGRKKYKNIINQFFEDIINFSWKGYNGTEFITNNRFYRAFGIGFMMQRVIPWYEKTFNTCWKNRYPYHDIPFFVDENRFVSAAKKMNSSFIDELSNGKNEIVVLDQPFSGDDPLSSMKFFDSPKAIVVDRNPVDTYIFLKKKLKNRGSFMPSDTVEHFVEYYKKIREEKKYISNGKNVLFVRFEDLVYKYDETTEKISNFLGIGPNPNPKTIFIPENSMANTQLKERFPEFDKDVKYIENELKEYLYDFSPFQKPDLNKKMFFGKSNVKKE